MKIEEPRTHGSQGGKDDARRGVKSRLASPTQQAFRTSKQI